LLFFYFSIDKNIAPHVIVVLPFSNIPDQAEATSPENVSIKLHVDETPHYWHRHASCFIVLVNNIELLRL
jgi:hypothetical protein